MAIEKYERICRNRLSFGEILHLCPITQKRKNDMLELGNFIPDFTAPDQDGNIVSSAELLGKKTVVYS